MKRAQELIILCIFMSISMAIAFLGDLDYTSKHNRLSSSSTTRTQILPPRTTTSCQVSRRDVLFQQGVGSFVLSTPFSAATATFLCNSAMAEAAGVTTPESIKPLADLPMIRLRLPKTAIGREYVVLKLNIENKGPFEFMVDTGLTTELISPHLQQSLGITASQQSKIQASAAGGATINDLVPLKGVSLCCGDFPTSGGQATELKLPSPLLAVVTDFPQEHIDPAHDVEGMLGQEILSQFDLDLDFPSGRVRLWQPGTGSQAAKAAGMVEIPAAVVNESGLYAIRIVSGKNSRQPVIGLIDSGSTFSVVNWAAAGLLGFPNKDYFQQQQGNSNSPTIVAVGIDGKPIPLPTSKQQLSFAGGIEKDPTTGKLIRFAPPPSAWKTWDAVPLAFGDLPVFSQILGDGVRPYNGPAALIGLDVLSQRRVIFEAGDVNTKRRQLYVSPE